MHELSVVIQVVETVKKIAIEQKLSEIDTIVLQIGELSSVLPMFVKEVYPAAVDGTMMEKTKLKIEMLPGNGRCKNCGSVYNLLANHRVCPNCESDSFEILGGKEFMIKEIIAR